MKRTLALLLAALRTNKPVFEPAASASSPASAADKAK